VSKWVWMELVKRPAIARVPAQLCQPSLAPALTSKSTNLFGVDACLPFPYVARPCRLHLYGDVYSSPVRCLHCINSNKLTLLSHYTNLQGSPVRRCVQLPWPGHAAEAAAHLRLFGRSSHARPAVWACTGGAQVGEAWVGRQGSGGTQVGELAGRAGWMP